MLNYKHRLIGVLILLSVLLCTVYVSGNPLEHEIKEDYALSDYAVDLDAASTRHISSAITDENVKNRLSTDGFELKTENGNLQIWFKEKTAAIRIVNKSTGYIWGGLAKDKPENMSEKWSEFGNSICTVEYYNKKDKVKQLPLSSQEVFSSYSFDRDGFVCSVNAKSLGIKFKFSVKLSGNSLTFSLDDKSISEKQENRIKSIYFMPFLGATDEDEIPGYAVLPDGSGALMRFSKKASYTSGFEKRIYGADVAVDNVSEQKDLQANRNNDYMVDVPQVSLPIFGMVHGNGANAFLSVCENGEEYATLTASPSGYVTDYNWAAFRFDYRQMYVYKAAQDGNGVNTVSKSKQNINPKQTFYFLDGNDATYSGMAVFYRELLREQKRLSENVAKNQIPINLSVMASEIKKGFFYNSQQVLSTVHQTDGIITQTEKLLGIKNITLTYYGWKQGGISGADYDSLKFNKKLGTAKELKHLKEKIENGGGNFYLALSGVTANKDQVNVSQMAAIGISGQECVYENPNQELMYWQDYILKLGFAKKYINKLYREYSGYSFLFNDIGYRLYSDYSRDNPFTRNDTKKEICNLLKNNTSGKTAVNSANAYLFPYIDCCFDVPTVSSQYLFETDSVPFVQIVLKGNIDCYGPYVNQGFYSKTNILKYIEYGMYPSFVVMAEENSKLTYTPLETYFSINYDDWKSTVKSVYKQISKALDCVEGAQIIEHKSPEDGVACVTYSNKRRIYVNYSSKDYEADGITVPSLDWYCEEVTQ